MFIEHLLGASPVKIKYNDGKDNKRPCPRGLWV